MASPTDNQKAIAVPVDVWVANDASLAIPVAGLLVSKPTLAETDQTPAQWQKSLDTYLKTPIDPAVDEPETAS